MIFKTDFQNIERLSYNWTVSLHWPTSCPFRDTKDETFVSQEYPSWRWGKSASEILPTPVGMSNWASTSLADLKELNISKSFEEIKLMTNNKIKNRVKDRVKESVFEFLLKKQGSKGKPNRYTELSMTEYWLPTNKILSITEKQEMFGVKNLMKNIPANNYPKPNEEYFCQCGKREEMSHIYDSHFEENYKRREILKNEKEFENLLLNWWPELTEHSSSDFVCCVVWFFCRFMMDLTL
jgi:hypothetical protein